jgi:1-acyl-sn-glycerol-3-phosphate acyltransferase
MLRATLVYIFVGLYVAIAGPIGMIWALLSRNTDCLYSLARTYIGVAGWICRIRVIVHGKERILPGQAYLFLSNHQSNCDGPILFYATQRNLRAVIKKEIMRIPLLAQALKQTNFVPVDRTDPLKARASIDRAAQLLKAGFSFFAFPEGTRTRDGSLGEFKKGVFVLAIKAGVSVMPVSIRNSRAIQPPSHYGIKPGFVEVIFHNPIVTEHMRLEDRDRLLGLTREAIANGLSD